MNIPTQGEYEDKERGMLLRQLDRVERAPLFDRQSARRDWKNALSNEPDFIGKMIDWLLAGNFGYGAMIKGKEILKMKRGNQIAHFGVLIAALNWYCPGNFARGAWNDLTTGEKKAANHAIKNILDSYNQ